MGDRSDDERTLVRRRCRLAGRLGIATALWTPSLLAQTVPAPAGEPSYAGWLRTAENERGQRCDYRGQHVEEDRVLIACGNSGLWEVALDPEGPRLVSSRDVGGGVLGFFEDTEGRVWVEVLTREARPLDALLGQSSGEPARERVAPLPKVRLAEEPARDARPQEQPRKSSPPPVGRVVALGEGSVVVSLGVVEGLSAGDYVELSVSHLEAVSEDESVVSHERITTGTVLAVSKHHAKIGLGLNERVPLGAMATKTTKAPRISLSSPPRLGDYWAVEVLARPFVALEELGGGLLTTASIGYRFEREFHVQALVDPIALADVDGSRGIVAANVVVMASFDSKYFELGLGPGVQTVNATSLGLDPGSGLVVAQAVRFGTRDGLHLSGRSSVVLFHRQFEFGAIAITGQIPLRTGYWLVLSGAGGNVGYGYGEFGLRVLLNGNGDRGSTFLTAMAGGAGVFKDGSCREIDDFPGTECSEDVSYAGPMGALGAEWRF